MRSKTKKSLSRLLGIWTFLVLLILKGAFPKPAFAFSTLDSCTRQPECIAAVGSELAPAIATPTASGAATTITATTAAGATTTTQAAAGVTLVGDMRLSGIAAYYIWKQAQNGQAQERARERYCAAYTADPVCGGVYELSLISPNNRYEHFIIYATEWNLKPDSYWGGSAYDLYFKTPSHTEFYYSIVVDLNTFTYKPVSPQPWEQWPQEKRSIAVAALSPADWLEFVKEMPVGGLFKPGDKVNAPGGVFIPGRLEDDPNTPEDERLLRKEPGFFTYPGLPNRDFDRDGTPDTSDPEPQNPNVPIASSEPPPPEESVPGVDVPFSAPDPAQPANEAVTDKARNMNIPEGKDCSEIAEDLLEAAGNVGEIIEVLPAQGQYLKLYEYGEEVDGFIYHQVYADGNYVYDPRLSPDPVRRGEWEEMIRKLNPGATFHSVYNQ